MSPCPLCTSSGVGSHNCLPLFRMGPMLFLYVNGKLVSNVIVIFFLFNCAFSKPNYIYIGWDLIFCHMPNTKTHSNHIQLLLSLGPLGSRALDTLQAILRQGVNQILRCIILYPNQQKMDVSKILLLKLKSYSLSMLDLI